MDGGEIRGPPSSVQVPSSFREFEAYKLAAALAVELRRLTMAWPSFDRFSLGDQLVRAAGSVGANIAEGSGRWHRADQRRFLFHARGSLTETEHWVLLACSAGLLEECWLTRVDDAARSLNKLIRSWGDG
jgi:four helix bundle protein